MPRTIYALLVGIDNYPPGVNSLAGCVNDIRRVEQLLQERVTGAGDVFKPLVLTDAGATRQGVIDAFRTHLAQAGGEDVVLFYYSGHGSQQQSPPEFWHLEPDHLDETLVCYDSRTSAWDLADKELAQLIAEVAQNGPHLVVILDCCHSGSGTRDLGETEEGVRVRRLPTDNRVRPFETFVVGVDQAGAFQPISRGGGQAGWYSLPAGRHVVLSACRAEEEAKELRLGGEQRGAFSYYLLDTLQRAGAALAYRDLFKQVDAQVRLTVSAQAPQMEATELDELDQPFLGGAVQPHPPYFTVSYDRNRQWVVDGGTLHGIPAPSDDETSHFALFPLDAAADQLRDLSAAVGTAKITAVFPGQSAVEVELADGAAPDTGTTYKAVVTALPLPPLVVALEGDEAAIDLLRQAMANAQPMGSSARMVREGGRDEAELTVEAVEDHYRIRRKGDPYALIVDTVGFTEAGAALVVQRLEHIARWLLIGRLANPASALAQDGVAMEIFVRDAQGDFVPAPPGSHIRLEYRYENGQWRQPEFKIKLANRSNRRLYYMLFDLPETYGVFPILPGGGIWLDPGQETWANRGEPLYASVLDSLWQEGVIEFKDTLKLIVSTEESDATLLRQDDLPVAVRSLPPTKPAPAQMHTLNRLMQRVPTRHVSSQPSSGEIYVDWHTDEVSFTVVRPLEATQIPAQGERVILGHGVTLEGHPSLSARARLSDVPQASRDAGNVSLPPMLRDHPDVFKPFEFTASRSGEPGLSVLELVDVEDHEAVTPEQPLVVAIDRPLGDDEMLLTLGFDGEFYLPLGRTRRFDDRTEVVLERLPAPTSQGTRDLKGAIRIYFQKVIGQRLGLEFPYPILAAVDVDANGKLTYQAAADAVSTQVAAAQRILLFVHGIIGDTRMLAAGARTGWLGLPVAPPSLADRYDLILTFDYESINTTIEQTARDLKQRLASVGLGPDHGKTLHIVAHSMGGLVSRWFVEREEGHRAVQHLILVGTPNAGSPWPTVQDWAFATLALGLNGLAAVSWPVKAIGSLVSATEAIDVSLDQMNPRSEFLATLASSPDPGVPYTIIAGNTSVIAAAQATDEGRGRLARLWDRIKKTNWVHAGANLVFFSQPNDIAVSVQSIRSVPGDRTPKPVTVEVPCDHVSYFSTQDGLQALADAAAAVAAGTA